MGCRRFAGEHLVCLPADLELAAREALIAVGAVVGAIVELRFGSSCADAQPAGNDKQAASIAVDGIPDHDVA